MAKRSDLKFYDHQRRRDALYLDDRAIYILL